MEYNIPLDVLMNLMKAADSQGNLEITDEGKEIRVKGMFSISDERRES